MVGDSLWVLPASSTTKIGRWNIAESDIKHNQSNIIVTYSTNKVFL